MEVFLKEHQTIKEKSPASTGEVGRGRLRRMLLLPLAMSVLVAIVWLCFSRTLSSYFLADDFSEIWYVAEIFKGNLDFLWGTLAGNYMNVPGMSVWRPCLLATLIFDYLLWGVDARGYYLTNLAYFTGDVLLLYLVSRELLRSWSGFRRELTAFFASALFAVSALHCESISWVVGRVDIVSCFYYLLSLSLMLWGRHCQTNRRRVLVGLAVVCFWIGLLTKEMAIGLPVVAALVYFFLYSTGTSFRARALEAFRFSLPLWLSTVVYFPLRFLVLGTFVGGYVGGFGSTQISTMVQKWLDPDTIGRLFYPLNLAVFGSASPYAQALSVCYLLALGLIVFRVLLADLPWKWLLLLSGWMVTAALPIFQLWGLGYNLEGSRFYFFLTLPASLLLPVLLLAPGKAEIEANSKHDRQNILARLNLKLFVIASVVLSVIVAVQFKVANKTNLVWVHAGKEVKAFSQSCQSLAASREDGTKFLLLGIPKEHAGAHQILNGTTFGTMLDAPFTSGKLSRCFLSFDPIMYGAADRINATRFKESLAMPGVKGPLVWSGERRGFEQVTFAPPQVQEVVQLSQRDGLWPHTLGHAICHVETQAGSAVQSPANKLVMERVQQGDGLRISGLDINPLGYHYLTFKLKHSATPVPPIVRVGWNSEQTAREPSGKESPQALHVQQVLPLTGESGATVRVRLSHYWRWYASSRIKELTLELFPCQRIEISDLRLVSGRESIPAISVVDSTPSQAGVYRLANDGCLQLDVKQIAGSPSDLVEFEIGKPNFFFANFPDDKQETAIGKKIRLGRDRANLRLDASALSGSGFFEIRCRALSSDGRPVSDYSDPVTVSSVR